MNDDVKRRKAAFRVAFDYLERWAAKIPAYASEANFWEAAWAECERLGEGADDLTKELLATAYWELERTWKRDRRDTA